ncbi:MAG: DUF1257 domain-containing protein [Spirochaetales bacterium]|nr:DUF1257 domain-containing protein [Spirochaetales bacterium]
MSHFTRVKTQIRDLCTFKEALKELDIEFTEAGETQDVTITGWQGKKEKVLMELKTGSSYSVGLVENKEGSYEFVADWWGVETYTGITREDYINKLTQKYAYCTVMDRIKDKGYDIVKEEVDGKQNIRILIRKWA